MNEGDAGSIKVKCACVRQPTMELRWNIARPPSFGFVLSGGFTPVLEQAYLCLACGEKSWRAIPTFPQPGVTR